MKRRLLALLPTPWRDPAESERGVVIVLVTLLIFAILGIAAFVVDFGAFYAEQLRTRKAMEAAALAAAVHMPTPDCVALVDGDVPTEAAEDVAQANGYLDTSRGGGYGIDVSQGANCAQVNVAVQHPFDTFFMKAFGIDTLNVNISATAEQLPPLRIGSDEPYLGEDPAVAGRNRDFFVAISGEDRTRGQGDAFAAARRDGGGGNPDFIQPSYWYAFEVPSTSSLASFRVQIYDPQANDFGSIGNGGPNGVTNDWVLDGGDDPGRNSQTTFRLYPPDDTPNDWRDNIQQGAVAGCNDTFRGRNAAGANASWNPALADTWVDICTVSPAQAGIYVLEVTSDQSSSISTDMINGFSIRGVDGSGAPVTSSADLQVYGLGSMSLWMFDTNSNPVFKIARVDEIYADSVLVLSLWDISDIGTSATVEFSGSLAGLDCDVRIRNDNNNPVTGWIGDSGSGSAGECYLSFNAQQYNNRWIDFRFELPGSYTCPAGNGSSPASPGCWAFVDYTVGGSITDRTTWSARIDGQPIHLLP